MEAQQLTKPTMAFACFLLSSSSAHTKTNIYDDRSRANNKKANKSCILRDEALKVVDKTKPSEDCARNSRAELLQSIIFFSLLRIDAFRGAKSRFLVSLRTGSWKIMRKKNCFNSIKTAAGSRNQGRYHSSGGTLTSPWLEKQN